MRRARLPLALMLIGAVSLPARAGLFDDEEARQRVEQLRGQTNARLDKLEASQQGQLDLFNQIEGLRAEVAKMRGQIESLTFELESAQKRQKDFYVDLDNRLRRLESQPAEEAKANEAKPSEPGADPGSETRDYESALNLFKTGKYKDSAAAFEGFIKNHPSGSYLPSAHYWAANSHYQLRNFNRASELYRKVAANWSSDAKAPDALLGLSTCQQETGDTRAANKTLESLVAKYPSSPAADIAKQRLKKR